MSAKVDQICSTLPSSSTQNPRTLNVHSLSRAPSRRVRICLPSRRSFVIRQTASFRLAAFGGLLLLLLSALLPASRIRRLNSRSFVYRAQVMLGYARGYYIMGKSMRRVEERAKYESANNLQLNFV